MTPWDTSVVLRNPGGRMLEPAELACARRGSGGWAQLVFREHCISWITRPQRRNVDRIRRAGMP
jgi:hypothetical protein